MNPGFWTVFQAVLKILAALGLAGWIFWRVLKRTEDPPKLLARLAVTAVVGYFLVTDTMPSMAQGGISAAFAVLSATLLGLIVAVVWTPVITGYVGEKFGNLYDGGDVPPDPKPVYSTAEALCNQGNYLAAAEQVRAQLALFPGDPQGMLMLGEIQAARLGDMPAARETIETLLTQADLGGPSIAFALTQLAEWELRYGGGVESARAVFERIVQWLPETEESHVALQRIAHLAPVEPNTARPEPRRLEVPVTLSDLGASLAREAASVVSAKAVARAEKLVAQLEAHPMDNQAREELALLYAEDFHRLDLAEAELEQLAAQPNAPDRNVVRWLGTMADLHIKFGADPERARSALARIVERFPGTPYAETAQRRLSTLGVEAKGTRNAPVLKLGVYEQDIGLKCDPRNLS